MNYSNRRTLAALSAALLALLAFASPALAIHFEKESLPAYEKQLAHGEVHAAAFHPGSGGAVGHLHVSLNDGRHMTVSYATGQQEKLVTQARAKLPATRVQVAVAKAKSKAVKHKLRYIAGGILIVVILVVLAVLLIGRRRALAEGEGGEASQERAASS